jgi:hypothetical protein
MRALQLSSMRALQLSTEKTERIRPFRARLRIHFGYPDGGQGNAGERPERRSGAGMRSAGFGPRNRFVLSKT